MICGVCQFDIPADYLSPVVAGCVRACPECDIDIVRTLTGNPGYEFEAGSPERYNFDQCQRMRKVRQLITRGK